MRGPQAPIKEQGQGHMVQSDSSQAFCVGVLLDGGQCVADPLQVHGRVSLAKELLNSLRILNVGVCVCVFVCVYVRVRVWNL